MTTKILFASQGLVHIDNRLLKKVVEKFNLGRLECARPTELGVMKQTMFIKTTQGQYILKGNPLYEGQLEEERYFTQELSKRITVSTFEAYSSKEKLEIVTALTRTLQELHAWQVSSFGEWNPLSNTLEPFEISFDQWLTRRITYWLKDAEKYSVISKKDWLWLESILNETIHSPATIDVPTFVMGDFKPENCLFYKCNGNWKVSAFLISLIVTLETL